LRLPAFRFLLFFVVVVVVVVVVVIARAIICQLTKVAGPRYSENRVKSQR
jgi:hypothetical protein